MKMTFEAFKRSVRNLKAVQETRIKVGNGIYGDLVEKTIKDSKLYPRIKELRRQKDSDRKQIAKLIKEALKEVGKTDDVLKKEFKLKKKEDFVYSELLRIERKAQKILEEDLEQMPLYQWLKQVKGLGILTSAQLLAIVGDMTRFPMPSSLWHYFGVGDPKTDRKITGVEARYNPKAKALLLGVIGQNFLRKNSQYKIVYDQRTAKTKYVHREWWHLNPDGTKATGRNMHPKHGYKDGIRVMMKRFLAEFWKAGYLAKGLQPPRKPYGTELPNHHLDSDIVPYKI